MIQLKINNMDHKAILTVPADYERVVLALWTIGLDRDPEKYTLRQLDAEFTYTTEEESQMVRLIDPRNSLMNALCFLSEMVYPPYPVAERIHNKMAAGGYASEDDFFIEMEKLVYDQNLDMHIFYAPVFELPMTGSTGSTAVTVLQIAGALVLLTALLYIVKKRR